MNRSASNLDREKLNQFPLLSLVVTINPKWNQYRTIPTRTNILSLSLSQFRFQAKDTGISSLPSEGT